MVSDINVDVPLGKSDHAAIGFTFNVHLDCLTNDKQVYQYNKADFEKMKDMLRLDWNVLLDKENVDDQWKLFEGEIHRVVDECVPTKCIKLNGGNRIKQESKSLRTKIKRKQRLWNRYIKDGDQEAKLEYNRVRNQIRGLTRKIVKKHEKKLADSVKTNPKSFWNYVKKKTKTKTSITDLYVDSNNIILTKTNSEKANVLADFFS